MVPYPRVESLPGLLERYGAEDIRCTANIWQDSIDAVHAVKDELSNYVELRYEDLIADPTGQILWLMNRLNLPRPSPTNNAFWEYLAEIGHVHHINHYGQYDVVEEIAGRTLRKLGYMPENEAHEREAPAPLPQQNAWDIDRGMLIAHGNTTDRWSEVTVMPPTPDRSIDQVVRDADEVDQEGS
jgi:hypothetical protein